MIMDLELSIRHTGQNWQVENEFLNLSAPTIDELDHLLKLLLIKEELLKKGETARIFMVYDNSTIPQWIRQYAQHYFNRILYIEG